MKTNQIYSRATRFILLIASLLVINQSCSDQVGISSGGGREGEVVVVLNEMFEKGEAGKVIDQYLCDSYLLLPQHEPLFKLYVIPWNAFTNTFKGFRNIIKVDINPKYTESNAKMQQNKNQTVISLTAPNSDEFVTLFHKHSRQIVEALTLSEKQFALHQIKKGENKNLEVFIANKHDVNVVIPKGYEIRKDTTDFCWLSLETNELSLGYIIYHYPYTDKNTFTPEYLIHKRDSLLERYIKGPLYPTKMSYMQTMREPVAPLFKEFTIDNEYATELNGLWNITEDYMAGPFLSVTRLDKERNRVVTVEGYVYHPSEKKRKYMRWFNAMLSEFRFPTKTSED
ncbi:MAG: DUF4837 family protein [Salinivirgaceae bacterium]|nr:DUF4837 family protein [Salinivirgaceae bacterium]MDD4745940.1 DUF4837 family protein [Salinivirgaceae bacterium]